MATASCTHAQCERRHTHPGVWPQRPPHRSAPVHVRVPGLLGDVYKGLAVLRALLHHSAAIQRDAQGCRQRWRRPRRGDSGRPRPQRGRQRRPESSDHYPISWFRMCAHVHTPRTAETRGQLGNKEAQSASGSLPETGTTRHTHSAALPRASDVWGVPWHAQMACAGASARVAKRTAARISSSTISFLFVCLAMSKAALPYCTPRAVSQHASSRATTHDQPRQPGSTDPTPRSLAHDGRARSCSGYARCPSH
jgi:hypothetical protein